MRYQWDGWDTHDMNPDLDDDPSSTADMRLQGGSQRGSQGGSRPHAPYPKPVKGNYGT